MRKIDNFTDEEFKNIVLESQTYSEISQKLGYSKNSTATKQIKGRCEKLNIYHYYILRDLILLTKN